MKNRIHDTSETETLCDQGPLEELWYDKTTFQILTTPKDLRFIEMPKYGEDQRQKKKKSIVLKRLHVVQEQKNVKDPTALRRKKIQQINKILLEMQ